MSASNDKLFLKAVRRQAVPRRPLWIMRQAGRYLPEYREFRQKHSFKELAGDAGLAAEVTRMVHGEDELQKVINASNALFGGADLATADSAIDLRWIHLVGRHPFRGRPACFHGPTDDELSQAFRSRGSMRA